MYGRQTDDGLAAALSWNRPRLEAALYHLRAHPDIGGPLVLLHIPPDAYTVTPRLDVLAPHQVDALTGRKNTQPAIRCPIQPADAEVLLRVWADGGIDTNDAAQRQALEDLAAAEMVTRGDIIDRFHDNVLYRWRQRHPHQLGQDGDPREPDIQDPQHPGSAPAGQHHADVLHQALQSWCPPLVAHGQAWYLLGEGRLRAGRVLAVQAAYGQVDARRPACERDVGEAPCVAAVAPLAELATSRASRWFTGSRAGPDRHHSIGNLNRDHLHIRQLR